MAHGINLVVCDEKEHNIINCVKRLRVNSLSSNQLACIIISVIISVTISVIMLINIFVSSAEFCVVHQYRSCFAGENEIQLLSGEEKTALQVGILQSTIQINSSLPIISGCL